MNLRKDFTHHMISGINAMYFNTYHLIAALLFSIGLWKIFSKYGEKGWWALIPGERYNKLGICTGREKEGKICMYLEILEVILQISLAFFIPKDSPDYSYALLCILILTLISIFYRIGIFQGIIHSFEKDMKWIYVWILFAWAASLVYGFLKSYIPHEIQEEDALAGTIPADISFDIEKMKEKEGLTVFLKDRIVSDFSKRRYLLKDIYFSIPKNSLVLLLGGSGAGKTTLVNAILGYEKANAEIYLNGGNIYDNYEQMKYRIGFAPQQDLLRQYDTVYHTLYDAAKLRMPLDCSEEDIKKRIEDVMHLLGLTAGSSGLVSKKSGGMRKRISIGMELISDPDLFVLDEPDSGLDGVIARELFEKLHDIAHQGNIVLTITHTPDRVADLFDYVIVLARDSGRVGRLAFCGTPDEAKAFFQKNSMEEIVMTVNKKEEGGEGRADEFIARYAEYAKGKDDHE